MRRIVVAAGGKGSWCVTAGDAESVSGAARAGWSFVATNM